MFYSLMCADKFLKKSIYSSLFRYNLFKKIIDKMLIAKNKLSIAYDVNWLNLWKKRFKKPELDAESFFISEKGIIKEIEIKLKKDLKNKWSVHGNY